MAVATSAAVGRVAPRPVSDLVERAYQEVSTMATPDLVTHLAQWLGRPSVARLTAAPDLKTVTRWSLGRNKPSEERLDPLRQAATVFLTLRELGLTDENAEQWMRGAHPALDFGMPIDALRDRKFREVIAAIAAWVRPE